MNFIPNNIKFLRKKNGFTQETFAKVLGINRPSIGAYEEGRADPRLTTLSKIAELFKVSVDELIHEDLTKKNRLPKDNVRILAVTVDNADNEYIQLVPIKAAAGYTGGFADPEYLTDLPRFHLPVLPKGGTYRAFEISGDSMLPILSGSIIIGKYVEQLNDIKNGKTYVLVTKSEGIVYKRVFNYLDEKGKLFLVSDNKSYNAYEIQPGEIMEVWEAKAYISVEFPDQNSANELSIDQLMDMIGTLRKDVEKLKNK
ncbi:MAG: LexA family transcriptional regulator [Ekhidna sp.]|nr:LexA family transcriptional regulator [Ekhidna sp.]MBC6410275.1 LexA family transcriptional regulator [Ekhidna sp.]